MTHSHAHSRASGFLSAGVAAALVRLLMERTTLFPEQGTFSEQSALDESCRLLSEYPKHEETLLASRKAQKLANEHSEDHAGSVEGLGGGWVGEEALAIAVYAVLSANSYIDCIRILQTTAARATVRPLLPANCGTQRMVWPVCLMPGLRMIDVLIPPPCI